MSAGEDSGRSSYLDLLISVLSQHEKNMDKVIEKMEKLTQGLAKAARSTKLSEEDEVPSEEAEPPKKGSETLTYMKIRLNRPLEEVLRILETLKE